MRLTPAKLNQKAKSILLRELGPVDYARFFQQYQQGLGNYTGDREQWLGTDGVEDIHAETLNLLAARKLPAHRPPNSMSKAPVKTIAKHLPPFSPQGRISDAVISALLGWVFPRLMTALMRQLLFKKMQKMRALA